MCAAASNKALADATLTAYELEASPADQPLDEQPRWRSSLGEIQQAAATLLETNAKLNAEARQLKDELVALQDQVDRQKVVNARLMDKFSQGRAPEAGVQEAADAARLKAMLADRNREIQAQQQQLDSLGARRGSMEGRVALARLKAAEAEVDVRSRGVEAKFRDVSSLNALRAEVQSLRDKIVREDNRVRLLEEKTRELEKVDNPHVRRTRELSSENSGLRQRWNALQEKKKSMQSAFEAAAVSKIKAEADLNVAGVEQLLEEREALQLRLKENGARIESLKKETDFPARAAAGVSFASMERIEERNKVMEDLVGNLRENVALLEYKVSTLQRYKDRNKPGFRK